MAAVKTALTTIAVLLIVGSAAATPPEVRRAQPVVPPGYTISDADVRATIAHMQSLAKDQQATIDGQNATNSQLAATVTTQAANLNTARTHNAAIRRTTADLAVQVKRQNDELAQEKWARLKERLWTWLLGAPITLGIGVVLGIFLALFSKFSGSLLALGAKVGLKATTGV